jgi:hypothetical protein
VATLALWLGGLTSSAKPNFTIFFVWFAGVMAVASLCFFWASREQHPAIRHVWWAGFMIVSLGYLVWRIVEEGRTPGTGKSIHLATDQGIIVPNSTTPIPSRSSALDNSDEFTFEPRKIAAKIQSARNPSEEEKIRKAFIGLSVDWTLWFAWAEPHGDSNKEKYWVVFFATGPEMIQPQLVSLRISFAGNEHLPLTDLAQKCRVKGVISEATTSLVSLHEGATVDRIAK